MKKIELNDRVYSDFFRQMSLLMHSGIRLDDACSVLADEETEGQYKEVLQQITSYLSAGSSLHEALSLSESFPTHVVSLVKTAEGVGRTEEVLSALADNYENRHRLKRTLINAVTYPLILLVIMLVIVAVLLSKVFPIFNEVYASLGSALTGIAAALLKIGDIIGDSIPYLGILFGVLLIFTAAVLAFPRLRSALKRVFMRWFGDRGIFRKYNNAFFVQNMAMILASGVPLTGGLDLSDDFLNERKGFCKRYKEARRRIEAGEDFSVVLRDLGFLDLAAYRMLSVAIRTGNVDNVISQIADRLSDEAEDALEESIAHIETAMVTVMSFLVGTILFSAMIPLIDIMKAFG